MLILAQSGDAVNRHRFHKILNDLVSHGTSGNECWGAWDSDGSKGWGGGYGHSCIHSGFTTSSGDIATAWYNYVLTSAGTIFDENATKTQPATNTDTATESICPKGWTLPSNTQIHTIAPNTGSSAAYVPVFLPTLGGYYSNGVQNSETVGTFYVGREAVDGARRGAMRYYNDRLNATSQPRRGGYPIRCVQKSQLTI